MIDMPQTCRSRRNGFRLWAALFLSSAAGCGYYSVEGGLPGHIRTVGVEFFENATAEPGLEERLSRAISDQLVSRSQVRNAPFSASDAVLRGTVVSAKEEPLTFTGTQVSRYRVTIVVNASAWDRARRSTIWERDGIQGQGQYDAAGAASSRDAAYSAAIQEAARQIVDGFLSGW